MMLEGLAFQRTIDEVFNLGQVEERNFYLAILALFLLEDALQLAHVAVLDDGTVAVAELDVFLTVVLLENLLECELLVIHFEGCVSFQEVDA